jgi:hypothetical protein
MFCCNLQPVYVHLQNVIVLVGLSVGRSGINNSGSRAGSKVTRTKVFVLFSGFESIHLGSNPDISEKYLMGNIIKGVAKTL